MYYILNSLIIFSYVNQNPPEVNANAAETLCAITRNAPSALATKLSSPRFVGFCILATKSTRPCLCFNLFVVLMFWANAVLWQGYLVMHWKIHIQNLVLSIHFLFVYPYWIQKDQQCLLP